MMEINLPSAIYPVSYCRERIMADLGVPEQTWYYHRGTMPQPDVELPGYQWYSREGFEALVAYWMGRPSVRRRMAQKAVSAGEGGL